jgi:hypothetical protein
VERLNDDKCDNGNAFLCPGEVVGCNHYDDDDEEDGVPRFAR